MGSSILCLWATLKECCKTYRCGRIGDYQCNHWSLLFLKFVEQSVLTCEEVASVTKHKPEINSRAADEIALAGGGVKEPAGFRNDTQI